MAVKKYYTDLLLNGITAEIFLQGLINKKDIENCSSVSGVIYNFNNKNLITFEDNLKSIGDVSMTIYFDFQTTAPTDNCFDPEQKNVCYVLCFSCYFSFATKPLEDYSTKKLWTCTATIIDN